MWVYGVAGAVGGSALTLAIVALWWGLRKAREHGARLGELEKRLSELEQAKLHTRAARAQADVAEAVLFQLVKLLDDKAVMDARLEQVVDLVEHIRAGGKPDDLRGARTRRVQ